MWIAVGLGAFMLFGSFFLMLLIFGVAFLMRRKKQLWEQLNQPLVANGALAAVLAWIGTRMTPPKPAGEDEGLAFIKAKRAFEDKCEAQRLFTGGGNQSPNG